MSIAQQIATPARPAPVRRPHGALRPVLRPRRGYALVRILGLVSATALCVALAVGAALLALLTIATSLGG